MTGKRMWNVVRAMFFMLREGISKGKVMLELNLMLKRVKNLVFHLQRRRNTTVSSGGVPASRHYEFSCTTTPSHSSFPFPMANFSFNKKNKLKHKQHHPPTTTFDDHFFPGNFFEDYLVNYSTAPSPYLPGFGRTPTPLVRPLRITDSPFPLKDDDDDPDDHGFIDQAAEDFIQRFYMDLKNQRISSFPYYSSSSS